MPVLVRARSHHTQNDRRRLYKAKIVHSMCTRWYKATLYILIYTDTFNIYATHALSVNFSTIIFRFSLLLLLFRRVSIVNIILLLFEQFVSLCIMICALCACACALSIYFVSSFLCGFFLLYLFTYTFFLFIRIHFFFFCWCLFVAFFLNVFFLFVFENLLWLLLLLRWHSRSFMFALSCWRWGHSLSFGSTHTVYTAHNMWSNISFLLEVSIWVSAFCRTRYDFCVFIFLVVFWVYINSKPILPFHSIWSLLHPLQQQQRHKQIIKEKNVRAELKKR